VIELYSLHAAMRKMEMKMEKTEKKNKVQGVGGVTFVSGCGIGWKWRRCKVG